MSADPSLFPAGHGWRFLAESVSVAVVRVSAAGLILAANRHATALVGEPLVGQPWHAMLLNFGGKVALADWLADAARPRLLNMRTASGIPATLEVIVEPMGADYLLCGEVNAAEQAQLGREVLELNRELNNLTRELALKNDELVKLNALKNQFLGMAAHDLRQPIGLILNYAEFLNDEAAAHLSAGHRDYLHTIQRAALRMRGVVDDFLDASLIEAGRFNVDVQPVDLAELVAAAVELVGPAATRRAVQIAVTLDAGGARILVDGPKIEQVLTNLLSNAVEHSPPGGCVSLGSQRLADELRIQVADSGAGIAPEQQQRLFQPFASGPAARKSSGVRSIGLGLAIARKIVDAHGGRMFVDSAPGRGSLFGFTLPAGVWLPQNMQRLQHDASGTR